LYDAQTPNQLDAYPYHRSKYLRSIGALSWDHPGKDRRRRRRKEKKIEEEEEDKRRDIE